MPKKSKIVKPINQNVKDYSLKLNYKVEEDIKPVKIQENKIFEMMGAHTNQQKTNNNKGTKYK